VEDGAASGVPLDRGRAEEEHAQRGLEVAELAVRRCRVEIESVAVSGQERPEMRALLDARPPGA
jgi:hypothetical protein